jgi:RimJ/RimL family protein N-acetyltransferase
MAKREAMKPYIRGKSIYFREVCLDDAEFIVSMRTNPSKSKYLSTTPLSVEKQRTFISDYLQSSTDFYFIICDWAGQPLGTIRLYDVIEDSFCWGSWILSDNHPPTAAVESALLMYDFAFFSLHYSRSHFDVRKGNSRVVDFHTRFGARVVREDELNIYFNYERDRYLSTREKYRRFLP